MHGPTVRSQWEVFSCERGAPENLIGEEFQSKNFLAMKFTTQHDRYQL